MRKSYSAVVLDDASHEKLVKAFEGKIPSDWKVIAHHMTIQFPGIPESAKAEVGKQVTLMVESIGISDKALAVKVSGYPSTNKIPHITIAINKTAGGQAKHSNDITGWNRILSPFPLTGTVEEIDC